MMRLLDATLMSRTSDGWVLMGQKCGNCGKVAFPRKRVCPECFSEDLADFPLSRTGTLHTHAHTILGISRLEAPYDIGFIDLPENIRVFSLIETDGNETLRIGQTMEMFIDRFWTDEDGEDVFCYKFRPSAEGGPQ